MSTNTAKEEKHSILEDLKQQAADIATKIKDATTAQLEALHLKLTAAHAEVQGITAQIASLSDKPAGKRRGRKPGSKNKKRNASAVPAKKTAKKGKRGAVGAAIRTYLAKKGKAGAHVKDIAKEIGNDPKNVTAFFYAKGNKKEFKNLGKATFASVK